MLGINIPTCGLAKTKKSCASIDFVFNVLKFYDFVGNSVDCQPCRRMYLQFFCDIAPMRDHCVDGNGKVVGNGFVGPSFDYISHDFLFSCA